MAVGIARDPYQRSVQVVDGGVCSDRWSIKCVLYNGFSFFFYLWITDFLGFFLGGFNNCVLSGLIIAVRW